MGVYNPRTKKTQIETPDSSEIGWVGSFLYLKTRFQTLSPTGRGFLLSWWLILWPFRSELGMTPIGVKLVGPGSSKVSGASYWTRSAVSYWHCYIRYLGVVVSGVKPAAMRKTSHSGTPVALSAIFR